MRIKKIREYQEFINKQDEIKAIIDEGEKEGQHCDCELESDCNCHDCDCGSDGECDCEDKDVTIKHPSEFINSLATKTIYEKVDESDKKEKLKSLLSKVKKMKNVKVEHEVIESDNKSIQLKLTFEFESNLKKITPEAISTIMGMLKGYILDMKYNTKEDKMEVDIKIFWHTLV